ncbi:MAG: hypothetical protein HWD59_13175 [Coxiellaceae bacterium]|nr:MAG: hypothetical protein HWD59_13175 [Coxiellaceae bacterium]
MAIIYFTAAAKSNDLKIRNKSLLALKELQKPVAKVTIATKTIPANLTDSELNQFYQIKDINPEKAKLILLKILTREPDNVTALKELGYLYLQENDNENAYAVFKQVYAITHDYPIAAQLGYIADKLNYQHQAYKYFATASHTSDPKLKLISNNAMTNLAGWNTRFLPDPYFIDYYFSPLYFSRFDLGIFPLNARIGVYLDQHHQVELYGGMRATRDDRTSGSAISPQIYEDNVAVFSIGSRYQPFRRIPVSFYGEIGRGYDLIYRFRDRWRSDIRGGLLSGAIWGKNLFRWFQFSL